MRPSLATIKQKKNLVGAEIGVQFGYNAKDILEELNISKLYLIDSYAPFPNASNNKIPYEATYGKGTEVFENTKKYLEKYNNKIIWIRKFSYDAYDDIPDGELDFVYIDGDHRSEICAKDIILYSPKVKIGGLVAGHDIHFNYVRSGVESVLGRGGYQELGDDWWVVKR